MMGKVKKVCSFCVSDWHFITMITPYINQKIKDKNKILIYSSHNYSLLIKTFLPKLMIENEKKQKIAELNWNESKVRKYSQIEEEIREAKEKNITIIVKGENPYIEKVNNLVAKWAKENEKKEVTVINCYDVGEFNQNLEEILKKHDKILNTSGEKEISEVFEGVS